MKSFDFNGFDFLKLIKSLGFLKRNRTHLGFKNRNIPLRATWQTIAHVIIVIKINN